MHEPKPHELEYELLEGDEGVAHDEVYRRRPEDAEPLSDEEYARRFDYALDALTEDRNQGLIDFQTQYGKNLLSQGIDPSRVNVWERKRDQYASMALKTINDVLDSDWAKKSTAKPAEERDAFDSAVVSVMLDRRSTLDRNVAKVGPDVTDFSVSTGVMRARNEFDGEKPDEAFLEKSEQTIKLLTAVGVYKFAKWGNSNQLQAAGKLLEAYARDVPGFEVYENGAHLARMCADGSTPAIRFDLRTKPNYQYARPELFSYMQGAEAAAESVLAAEAHHLVETYDFEVPEGYVSAAEAQADKDMEGESQQEVQPASSEQSVGRAAVAAEVKADTKVDTKPERPVVAYGGRISISGSFF